MNRIKIFVGRSTSPDVLEKRVNDWLESINIDIGLGTKTIVSWLQSSDDDRLTITVVYKTK
jgi:hypothetical protein